MIKNDALSERLNSFKEGKSPKKSQKTPINPIYEFAGLIYSGIISVVRILAFGYTAKVLFNTDWNFLTILCIGFTFNFLLTYIYDIIRNR